MGAEQSIDAQQQPQPPIGKGSLQILKSDVWMASGFREDSRYGEFKLFATQDGRQIAIVNKTCQQYGDYATLCSKLAKAKQINSIPGMVKLLEVTTQEEGNLCSSFYKVTAVYEYLDRVVDDDLKAGQSHSTELIVSLLTQLLATLSELYSHGIVHGDVTPHSILIQGQQFKLNNVQQMTGFNQYKRILLAADECRWHLPPELLESLAKRELRPNYDCQRCDVYSLALTCLEMGVGGLDDLYETDCTMNTNILQSLLAQFQNKHGEPLTTFLRQMLHEQVSQRPTFTELHQQLPKMQQLMQAQEVKPVVPVQRTKSQHLAVQVDCRPIVQSLSPTHQPTFHSNFTQSRQLSPLTQQSIHSVVAPHQQHPVPHQQHPAPVPHQQQASQYDLHKMVSNYDLLQSNLYPVVGLKEQRNSNIITRPPTPTTIKTKIQMFQSKPITSLKRPKHDQNQFKPHVKAPLFNKK